MSDPVIRRVRRSIDEAKNRGGMRAGMPKVTIDAADAERLCILSEGLIKATSKSGWHERQKWAVEEQLTTVQAENEALLARVAELESELEFISGIGSKLTKAATLRKQAEAITKASNEAHNKLFEQAMLSRDSGEAISAFMDYAQRLRQQAADLEAKTAGGGL